jgi:hypothetical protein
MAKTKRLPIGEAEGSMSRPCGWHNLKRRHSHQELSRTLNKIMAHDGALRVYQFRMAQELQSMLPGEELTGFTTPGRNFL